MTSEIITADTLEREGADPKFVNWMRAAAPLGLSYVGLARELYDRHGPNLWQEWLVLECRSGTWDEHVWAAELTEDCEATRIQMLLECAVGTFDERLELCNAIGGIMTRGLCDIAVAAADATPEQRETALNRAEIMIHTVEELIATKYGKHCVGSAPVLNEPGEALNKQMLVDAGAYFTDEDWFLSMPEAFTFEELAMEAYEEAREWMAEACPFGTWNEHLNAAEEAVWRDDVLKQMVVECPVGTWEQRMSLCRRCGLRSLDMMLRTALSCGVGTLEQRMAAVAAALEYVDGCRQRVALRYAEATGG